MAKKRKENKEGIGFVKPKKKAEQNLDMTEANRALTVSWVEMKTADSFSHFQR